MRAKIAMYNIGRGYGFLAVGAKQIFFHAKNFQVGFQPVIGRWVEFEMGPGLNGRPAQAINVRYADSDVIEQKFQELTQQASLSGKGGAS